MSHHELVVFFLAVGVLLLAARVLGEIARSLNQPAVLGEILAGIILGPTVFGALAPEAQAWLFPQAGGFPIALQAVTVLAITLFLLVAGLEVNLSAVLRQGRSTAIISLFGMIIPFAVGFGCAHYFPATFGAEPNSPPLIFSLFVGTALAISALPVIVKTLLDLNIYKSDFGMLVVSVAVIDDLAGWMLFAVILGMMGSQSEGFLSVQATIGATLAFAVVLLTVGRAVINRLLPLVQAYTSWPGGVLSFAVIGALFCAAFTEWIGIHAIFGAFLFGVALGDSSHLREKTRHTLEYFIAFIFAPLFFASVGLRVDFARNFDLFLVLAVIAIACIGKIFGCGLAGRLSGYSWRESWAIGFGMNARGAMEIILALLALNAGLISERMFVALVIMALFTSMIAGGLMQKILQRKKAVRFFSYLPSSAFLPKLAATDRRGAITELAEAACRGTALSAGAVAEAAWEREQNVSSGIGNGVAIPHARLETLASPVVALGISPCGIDFDSPDGEPARLVFLILTPKKDSEVQLEILADIGRTFRDQETRELSMRARTFTEFISGLKSCNS